MGSLTLLAPLLLWYPTLFLGWFFLLEQVLKGVGPTLFFVWTAIMLGLNCKNNFKSYTYSCEIHFKAQHSGKVIIFFFSSPGVATHIFEKVDLI